MYVPSVKSVLAVPAACPSKFSHPTIQAIKGTNLGGATCLIVKYNPPNLLVILENIYIYLYSYIHT